MPVPMWLARAKRWDRFTHVKEKTKPRISYVERGMLSVVRHWASTVHSQCSVPPLSAMMR